MGDDTEHVLEVTGLDIALATIEYALTIVILFVCTLVIVAVKRYPQLHTPTNYLIFNLAVADLLVGLGLPYLATFHIVPQLNFMKYACLVRYFIISATCLESSWTLVLISLDRFLAIEFPLRYTYYINNNRTIAIAIGVTWIYTILFTLTPMMGWNAWYREPSICTYADLMDPVYTLVLVAHFIVMVVLMVCLYGRIFWTAKRQSRRISAVEHHVHHDPTHTGNKIAKGISKATRVLILVLGVYLLTWTPFALVITGQAIMALNGNPNFNNPTLVYAEVITGLIGITNSVWNPMIYAWKNQQYRRAFRKILHLKREDDITATTNVYTSVVPRSTVTTRHY